MADDRSHPPDERLHAAAASIATSLRHLADAVEALGAAEPEMRSDRSAEGNTLFSGMDGDARRRLLDAMDIRDVAAGDTVFRQGDPSDGLYLLERGVVDVVISAAGPEASGRRRIQSFVAGMFFGEMGLFDGGPRSATVVARSDVRYRVLHRSLITRLKQEAPEDYAALLEAIVRELSRRVRFAAGILRSDLG